MNKTKNISFLTSLIILIASSAFCQITQPATSFSPPTQKIVIITGVRFSYGLVEKWIDDYRKINPSTQIVVEARGSHDPQKYDILVEIHDHPAEIKETRAYVNIGRYAVFPAANSASSFSKIYSKEGLTKQHILQLFFHDIFADREKQKTIKAPYTVYTRLQKAGVPMVFAKYFGFEQKDIKGNGIAGADAHLVKALLLDSTGLTYLPTPILYQKGKTIEGLSVIPVDLNGNGKITDDEKSVNDFESVIDKLENAEPGAFKNVPIEYLHLSVNKDNASAEAIDFLKWVNDNGQKDLHDFGFLLPERSKADQEKFSDFASKKGR